MLATVELKTANPQSGDGPPFMSRRRAYYGLAVLMLAFMVAMVDRVVLALLVDPIQRDLGLTDTQFGLLNGLAFAIFYLAMSIPIARLADRVPRRRIIAIGIAVWSVMTALCGFAQSTLQLFLARIGVGVGESALSPAAYSMMADMFPRDQLGRAFGIYNAGALVGFGASLIVGGSVIAFVEQYPDLSFPLIGAVRSWQAVFFAVALPGLIVALLMLTVREPARRVLPNPQADPSAEIAASPAFAAFMRERASFFVLYFFAFGCLGMVLYGTLAWLPALLTRSYGIDKATTGIALGIGIGIASPLGAICGGALADRLTAQGRADAPMIVGLIGSIGAFLFVVAAPIVPDWRLSIALTCGLFFCLTLPTSVGPAGVQIITPPGIRAQVTAAYVIVTGLAGMAIGSVTIGALTDYVFHDKTAVGWSIALFGAIVTPLMGLTFQLLRKKFAVMSRASI